MKLYFDKRIRLAVNLIAGLFLASLMQVSATAAPWPTKPIKIIVPFSPGSVQDALARSFSNELGVALGETVSDAGPESMKFKFLLGRRRSGLSHDQGFARRLPSHEALLRRGKNVSMSVDGRWTTLRH